MSNSKSTANNSNGNANAEEVEDLTNTKPKGGRLASLVLLSPCLGFPASRIPKDGDKQMRHHIFEYAFDYLFEQRKDGLIPAL